MSSEMFIPSTAKSQVERPYNKGILLNTPSQMIPVGGMLEAKNFMSHDRGMKRRPGIQPYCATQVPYPPWQDLVTFWKVTGTQEFLGIDDRFLYSIEVPAYNGIYWEFRETPAGTTHVDFSTLTSTITADADVHWDHTAEQLAAGDVIVYGASWEFQDTISSITDGTEIILTANASGTYHGVNWKIRRAFQGGQPYFVDFTVLSGGTPLVLFADGGRPLYAYNGTTLGAFKAAETLIPTCVTIHKNRVWVANYLEAGVQHRQGIAWTELGYASATPFATGGYVDLPYVKGAIKKLVPMGDFLVAFFDDAIYIGRPTNLPTMPLSFQKLETGGVGLLGMKAVVPFLDGMFFVGQDDVYYLSSRGIEGIASPVVQRTIRTCSNSKAWRIFGALDLVNSRVLFGFPEAGNETAAIWSFNYRTKAWAWDAVVCQMVTTHIPAGTKTWEKWASADYKAGTVDTTATDQTLTGSGTGWAAWGVVAGDTILIDLDNDGNLEWQTTVLGTIAATTLEMTDAAPSTAAGCTYRIVHPAASWSGSEIAVYPNWESIGSTSAIPSLYVLRYDTIDIYNDTATSDNGVAIPVELITGDRDFDIPDDDKTFYRMAVKLDAPMQVDLAFAVQGSQDRGGHWKNLGTLRIPTGKDEGKVDFRMTGSIGRFRLVSISITEPYIINEITMKVRVLGAETAGRSDQP